MTPGGAHADVVEAAGPALMIHAGPWAAAGAKWGSVGPRHVTLPIVAKNVWELAPLGGAQRQRVCQACGAFDTSVMQVGETRLYFVEAQSGAA